MRVSIRRSRSRPTGVPRTVGQQLRFVIAVLTYKP